MSYAATPAPPLSLPENAMVTDFATVTAAVGAVNAATGGVTSTSQLTDALPTPDACTATVCEPAAIPVSASGWLVPHAVPAPSTEQLKATCLAPDSVSCRRNVACCAFVTASTSPTMLTPMAPSEHAPAALFHHGWTTQPSTLPI